MSTYTASKIRYFILGLGRTGKAVCEFLLRQGKDVFIYDDYPTEEMKDLEQLGARWVSIDPMPSFLSTDICIVSPGVPVHFPQPHPFVRYAREQGISVIGDVEFYFQYVAPKTSVIGVTGTNGKSTTCSLIAHLFNNMGIEYVAAGNIGLPICTLEGDHNLVLELSSYQLELTFSEILECAVLLNISKDHLAHHGTMEAYIEAKRRIFSLLKPEGTTIIAVDDPHTQALFLDLKQNMSSKARKIIPIALTPLHEPGIFVEKGCLVDTFFERGQEILDLSGMLHLKGSHNWQNIACAYAVLRSSPYENMKEVFLQGIHSFPGVAHRQQFVRTVRRITFINDSKATNFDAASKALDVFDHIYWLVGGQKKDTDTDIGLFTPYQHKIQKIFCFGHDRDFFQKHLSQLAPVASYQTLKEAFHAAVSVACQDPQESSVLLSPACASFDAFENFEQRGCYFQQLVEQVT